MIIGRIERLHALIPITFRLPGRPDLTIEFVIDTGFTGSLALPAQAVAALQLPYVEEVTANLANDTDVNMDVHAATILWNGIDLEVRVLAAGKRALLGTGLLAGNELIAQFVGGGRVAVNELRPD